MDGAFIGALAVGIQTDYRSPQDVDALVKAESFDLGKFLQKAGEFGIVPRSEDIEKDAKTILVLRLVDQQTGVPVDLSLAFTPLETEIIQEADRLTVRGGVLNVARPEDLIIMKAVAHRLHDLADMKKLLEFYPNTDLARVEHWVRLFGEALDEPDLWERIHTIIEGRSGA